MTIFRKATLALAISAMIGGVALSQGSEDHEQARALRDAGDILPLETILERIRPQAQGRIIEAELYRSGDRYWYEIELVDSDGAVHELHVDASSGEVASREREH